jgi:hypothetical protein
MVMPIRSTHALGRDSLQVYEFLLALPPAFPKITFAVLFSIAQMPLSEFL